MQISDRWWLVESGWLGYGVLWVLFLYVVWWLVRCNSWAALAQELGVILFIIRLISIWWHSQGYSGRVFNAWLNMLLYGDKRREVVLAGAQIIYMNSFVVFIVILEFLVYLYLKALSISHHVLRLSILVDLPHALLRWVLRERESDCGVY